MSFSSLSNGDEFAFVTDNFIADSAKIAYDIRLFRISSTQYAKVSNLGVSSSASPESRGSTTLETISGDPEVVKLFRSSNTLT